MVTDPPTPVVTEQDVKTGEAFNEVTQISVQILDTFSGAGNLAKDALSTFNSKLVASGVMLKEHSNLTQSQAAAFGMLSVSVLGVRKSFDNLSNIDTQGLDTLKGQWTDLVGMMKSAPVGAMPAMISSLKNIGAPGEVVENVAKKGVKALMSYGEAFLESADNGLRLQNAMVQLAARTGGLNDIFKAAGPGLHNMNALLQKQQKSLTETAGATGLNAKIVEQYYSQLGAVPGALQENVKITNKAGESTSMLTASIQLAKGSGRGYEEVIDDLKKAFTDYNLKGEDALRFTARMSELSNRFGIELSDVKSSLRSTADMFKMFGNESEGAAKMMNNYLGALEKTGISGKVALEVMGGMTAGIKGMSLAQKGFLSAQTGGPGGLMGGFQIEKMLREGKMDEVMEKVRTQMTKQMGSIVTLDDAEKSPQAAAQMTKQMLMLQQGPMGKFAKDDQSAMRILEAFKAREQGGEVADLSKSIVQDQMKNGVDLQDKSLTELTRIRELLQGNQGFASMANLTTAQHGFTAGVGTAFTGGDYNREYRNNLKKNEAKASRMSGATTNQFGSSTNILGSWGGEQVNGFKGLLDELGPALKAPINKIKDLLKSGKDTDARKEYEAFMADIERRKKELKDQPLLVRAQAMENIARDEQSMKSAYGMLATTGGTAGDKKATMAPDMTLHASAVGGPSGSVNAAANRAAAGKTPGAQSGTGSPSGQSGDAQNGHLTIHVEGFCLSCGDKMKNDKIRKSMAVGTNVDK